MYLKSLTIQGFKSFPDKVELEFNGGITSIVGPNGSGKSNISDAIRWVLGEQSAKVLRGSKMEDIIFAGSENRRALGFAEVSLTIDNNDETLPLEFNEVTVTRRVYRSGESEYFINRSSCRLKDIYELFMDTGLGKDGYSIIGQGRIEEILSTKSEDRRHIFEEAAGISKYRHRKEESERKLELTSQNLTRVNDIINELEIQLEPLKQQSEKAKIFLKMKERLKVLEVNVLLSKIDKLKASINHANQDYEILKNQLNDEKLNLNKFENEIDRLNSFAKSKENEIGILKEKLFTSESEIQKQENEINIHKNNIINNKNNLRNTQIEVQKVNDAIQKLNLQFNEKNNCLRELTERKKDLNDTMDNLQLKDKQISEKINSGNMEIDSLKTEIIEKMNKISDIKVKRNSFEVMRNNFIDRNDVIIKEFNEKSERIEQSEKNIKAVENEFEITQAEIIKLKDSTKKYLSEINCNENKLHQMKKEHSENTAKYGSSISKKNLLVEMENEYEGFAKSVKVILKQRKEGKLKHLAIYGPVAQLIDVPARYITAVETALGSSIQNIVVESEYDAKGAIEFLKVNRLGRATFFPISSMKSRFMSRREYEIKNCMGFLGIASEVIEFDQKFKNIIENLLGRVVIADNIDNAINMAKRFRYTFKIVTLDGNVLNPGGSLTGGSRVHVNGFLSRAKEIEKLSKVIHNLKISIDDINKNIESKIDQINKLKGILNEKNEKLKLYEAKYIQFEGEIKHKKEIYQTLIKGKNNLINEKHQIDEQLCSIDSEILDFSNVIKNIENSINDIKQLILDKQEAYKNELSEKEQLTKTITNHRIKIISINKEIDLLKTQISEIENQINNNISIVNQKNEQIEYLNNKNKVINVLIKENNCKIINLRENIKSIKNSLDECSIIKDETQKKVADMQDKIKDKRKNVDLLNERYHKLENQKIKVNVDLENAINKLWDDYELTYSTALEYKKDIGSAASAYKEIKNIKENIKQLGNVNVNAVEEYKNVKNRYDFLCSQANDLKEAEKSLLKLIDDMVIVMTKQFISQFKIINEKFNKVFIKLFEGGKAELKLLQPDDVLNSGIEIEVQPPGKKLQNLMLLSGGEKAFTAIALLFAILEVNCTPFCVFDEIEAALDDTNVYKFAQYLKDYSDNTQFILITHRRGTMEIADLLYGVTMQEKGVSKVVSLKMEQAS